MSRRAYYERDNEQLRAERDRLRALLERTESEFIVCLSLGYGCHPSEGKHSEDCCRRKAVLFDIRKELGK